MGSLRIRAAKLSLIDSERSPLKNREAVAGLCPGVSERASARLAQAQVRDATIIAESRALIAWFTRNVSRFYRQQTVKDLFQLTSRT